MFLQVNGQALVTHRQGAFNPSAEMGYDIRSVEVAVMVRAHWSIYSVHR